MIDLKLIREKFTEFMALIETDYDEADRCARINPYFANFLRRRIALAHEIDKLLKA